MPHAWSFGRDQEVEIDSINKEADHLEEVSRISSGSMWKPEARKYDSSSQELAVE